MLPPCLLSNHPHTSTSSRPRLSRLLRDTKLESSHSVETALKGLAGLNVGEHGRVVHGLVVDDGIVGRALEKGRLGEVEEDAIAVQAAHVGDRDRGAPLDLVERRVVGV